MQKDYSYINRGNNSQYPKYSFPLLFDFKQFFQMCQTLLLDFQLGCTLGSGAFGKVRKAIHKKTGHTVAVKSIMKRKIKTDEDRKRVKRQIQILKKVNHPNLLQLLQVIQSDQTYYLITELVEGEQLFQKINRLGKIHQESAAHYFIQLLDAVLYLQKLGICHRDIKPQNIIVRGKTLKIIDFGLGNFYNEGQLLQTSCGSPCYAAPQMMSQKQYDPKKTQIWALGVTLYAMLTGRLPFQHNNTSKLYKIMSKGQYQQIQGVSSSLKSLIRAMIEPNPQLRIDIVDICTHIWVRSFNYKFHVNSSINWKDNNLQSLQKIFKKSKEQLKRQITTKFGPQRVYYFSLAQTQSQKGTYQGPLHLSLVFFSLSAAQVQAKNKFPNAIWINPHEADINNTRLAIKKVSKNNIYTICLQNKK